MAKKQAPEKRRKRKLIDAGQQRCNRGAAAEFASQSAAVHQRFLALSDMAQIALGDWPDSLGTGELRTLLLEVVEAAESEARRWEALAGRFDALVTAGAHLHMIGGQIVVVVGEGDVIDAVAADRV